jgi:hypothetical protein
MNWTDVSKEKPQESVKYFFKIYYGNNAEEKLVGYYYNKKGKEYFSEAFDGETYKLEELTECYWLDETPEDWESLEKKFNKDFSTLTDKPMVGYDVIKWFRNYLQ